MPHITRSRRTSRSRKGWHHILTVVTALLLVLISEQYGAPFSPITQQLSTALQQKPYLLLLIGEDRCSLCDDLSAHLARLPPSAVLATREIRIHDFAERKALIAFLNNKYAGNIPMTDALPLYLLLTDDRIIGYGTGLDNQDYLIGFYPGRHPVAVAAVLVNPAEALMNSSAP